MKVIDASAFIDVLIGATRRDQLLPLLDDDLFAPDLLVPEVLGALRRLIAHGDIDAVEAEAAATAFRAAPVEYLPIWPYTERVWQLRNNLSTYDACYIALAEDLNAPLVTTDLRLARSAAGMVAIITV